MITRPPQRNVGPSADPWAKWIEAQVLSLNKTLSLQKSSISSLASVSNNALSLGNSNRASADEMFNVLGSTVSSADGAVTWSPDEPTNDRVFVPGDGSEENPDGYYTEASVPPNNNAIWYQIDAVTGTVLTVWQWEPSALEDEPGQWVKQEWGTNTLADGAVDWDKLNADIDDAIHRSIDTAATADGKITVALVDPTAGDGDNKPIGALWEVRVNNVAVRRFIWDGTAWEPYTLGSAFIGDNAIDWDNLAAEIDGAIQTATDVSVSADGKITISDRNPVSADAEDKPTNAIWEVRSGAIVLRRFMLSAAGVWEQVAVGQDFIGENAIGSAQIIDASVGNAQIANLAVNEAKIANLAVTNAKIAELAVKNANIDDLAVTGAKIANATIGEAHIIDASIGTAKIGAAQITEALIDDLAVSEAKIKNAAISSAKIAELAVQEAHIEDLAITEAKIANAAITNAKIANLDAGKINAGTLDAARINGLEVNGMYITGSLMEVGGNGLPKLRLGPLGPLSNPGTNYGLYLTTTNGNEHGSLSIEVSPTGPKLEMRNSDNEISARFSETEGNILVGALRSNYPGKPGMITLNTTSAGQFPALWFSSDGSIDSNQAAIYVTSNYEMIIRNRTSPVGGQGPIEMRPGVWAPNMFAVGGTNSRNPASYFSNTGMGLLGTAFFYNDIYNTGMPTSSFAANVGIASSPNGRLYKVSSLRALKAQIKSHSVNMNLLDLDVRSWVDKATEQWRIEQLEKNEMLASVGREDQMEPIPERGRRISGVVAEEVEELGEEETLIRDADGNLEGVQYDRLGLRYTQAVLSLVRQLEDRINKLESMVK